jgi:hypothetical protein
LGNTVEGGEAAPPSQDVVVVVERVEKLLPSFSSLMKYREDDDHELMIAAAAGRRIWCPIMAGIDDAAILGIVRGSVVPEDARRPVAVAVVGVGDDDAIRR